MKQWEMTPSEFEQKMKKLSVNRKDFAKKLKVSNGLVAGMITGHRKISDKTIEKIQKLEVGEKIVGKVYGQPKPEVTFEHITPKGQLVTVELPNGIKISVKGTLKEIVKQLMKTKGE